MQQVKIIYYKEEMIYTAVNEILLSIIATKNCDIPENFRNQMKIINI